MVALDQIVESTRKRRVRITDHADEEAHNDGLSFDEIYSSVLVGEIIEQYPADEPYPSCLIYGKNIRDEPIHSVWAYNKEAESAALITVYRPDPSRWIDCRIRRKS